MSRLAVKSYVAAQFASLNVPGNCTVCYEDPKVEEVVTQALLVIRILRSRETRYTMPRLTGNKKIEHEVSVTVNWITDDEQAGGRIFDAVLEQLDGFMRAAPLPADLTDPDSGLPSRLLFAGETIETEVVPPEQADSQLGAVVFGALKLYNLTELVQG
jgi:hypothetical protein